MVDGAFYAAAFSNDETAIRLAVNPAAAPSSVHWTLGAVAPGAVNSEPTWERTATGVAQREVYELVHDDIAYFRLEMPESMVYVYGPEEIRPQILELVEALSQVEVGARRDQP